MKKEEQMEMSFMKEYKQREVDRICLLQYENLRKEFNKNLVEPILGKDYYNMGMCTYSCDRFTTEDLAYKFRKLTEHNKFLKYSAVTSLVANIVLITLLLIAL